MSSYSREQLESWLKTIEINGCNVLDVGGSQLTLNGRLKVFKPDEYKILDLEEPHEVKRKPDIVCDLNSDWELKDTKYYNDNETFDTVFCLEVSEYWWNPVQALKNINWFLKKDGLLYISFHFYYPIHNPVEQDYLRYTKRGVEKLLEETGFKIKEILPRLMTQDITRIDGMRPAKDYKYHNWQGCLVKAIKS